MSQRLPLLRAIRSIRSSRRFSTSPASVSRQLRTPVLVVGTTLLGLGLYAFSKPIYADTQLPKSDSGRVYQQLSVMPSRRYSESSAKIDVETNTLPTSGGERKVMESEDENSLGNDAYKYSQAEDIRTGRSDVDLIRQETSKEEEESIDDTTNSYKSNSNEDNEKESEEEAENEGPEAFGKVLWKTGKVNY
jgi:hypothetical protein